MDFYQNGLADVNINCTEFKFQHATNFDLNTLIFSHYKNTQRGKALTGILAHGSGLLFSDIQGRTEPILRFGQEKKIAPFPPPPPQKKKGENLTKKKDLLITKFITSSYK